MLRNADLRFLFFASTFCGIRIRFCSCAGHISESHKYVRVLPLRLSSPLPLSRPTHRSRMEIGDGNKRSGFPRGPGDIDEIEYPAWLAANSSTAAESNHVGW